MKLEFYASKEKLEIFREKFLLDLEKDSNISEEFEQYGEYFIQIKIDKSSFLNDVKSTVRPILKCYVKVMKDMNYYFDYEMFRRIIKIPIINQKNNQVRSIHEL